MVSLMAFPCQAGEKVFPLFIISTCRNPPEEKRQKICVSTLKKLLLAWKMRTQEMGIQSIYIYIKKKPHVTLNVLF